MEDDNKKISSKTESIIEQKIEIKEELTEKTISQLKEIVKKDNAGLLVLKGTNIGEIFAINKEYFNIGREIDSDIFLDDITVSRKHASIMKTDKYFKVVDMGSLNGIYVNGKLIEEKYLENGDKIQIGKYVFYFFCLNNE
ncbi:MAG TPA: FHA domain-containing protein [Actinobacteria bacterium]|nr:FHA domain-containing protein [Actinomycetota bacterium]